MPGETHQNSEIRNYLLGALPAEEAMRRVEERLMTDDEYFRQFSIEEDDLIQDYADGSLTDAERLNFEGNFLVSEERREKVRVARALRQYLDEEGFPGGGKSFAAGRDGEKSRLSFFQSVLVPLRQPRTAFAALAVVVFSAVCVWVFLTKSSENDGGGADNQKVLASLNRAYEKERPFESRISGLEYAPANNLRGGGGGGGGGKEKLDKPARDRAMSLSLELTEKSRTAENLHALARVYLAERDFDTALKQLEEALTLAPRDAEILSDLGAGLLEKSRRLSAEEKGGEKLDLAARALENINRALEINPDSAPARFNRALALQELVHSNEEARRAWQEYLKLDADSKWAEEARRNLAALGDGKPRSRTKEQLREEFLISYRHGDDEAAWRIISRNREMIKGKLIHHQLALLFLDAEAGGSKKAEYLAALQYAAELERRKTADPYFAEIAAFYAAAPPEKQLLLKAGHDFLTKGFELDLGGSYQAAYEEFKRAEAAFSAAGSAWESRLAEYWAAFCRHSLRDLATHRETLERLAEFCRRKNYKWFLAEIYVWLGVNAEESTEYSKAIDYHKKAVALCEEISDTYNLQKTLAILADEYAYLKQFQAALSALQKSLALSAQIPETSPRQKWRNFNTAAAVFYSLKRYAAAVAFEREALAVGEETDDLTFKRVAALNLAMIYGRQEKYPEAIEFLKQSRQAAELLPDESTRTRYLAAVHTQQANFKRLSGGAAADSILEDYNKAIAYSSAKYKPEEYNARKGRLLYYIAQKNDAALEEEIPAVLELFERNRRQITEESSRNTFFDNEQDVYDLAIDYEYGKKNFELAFNYSEISRSRSLLDFLKYGPGGARQGGGETEIRFPDIAEPLGLEDIRRELPERVQIVQYAVLGDKVVIWLVTKNKLVTRHAPVGAQELNGKVAAYLEHLTDRTSRADGGGGGGAPQKAQDLSKEVYRILIAPVLDELDPAKEIVFVPDKFLFRLPFPGLVSPSGKYLVEEFAGFYAPSSNVFLVSSRNAAARKPSGGTARENLLAIGNPSFDPNSFPDLPDLPSARTEVEKIAEIYSSGNLLTGTDAAKGEIKRRLPHAELIHFAGHYVVDEASPSRSFLLLAGGGDDALLPNYELTRENLTPRARLIVLSACDTGAERYYNGEGMVGAARTFLGSGIPLVVASHWQVDSRAAENLMTRFHRYRKGENLSTIAALRRAQLEMLNEPGGSYREPFYWAAFAPIGGYSEF